MAFGGRKPTPNSVAEGDGLPTLWFELFFFLVMDSEDASVWLSSLHALWGVVNNIVEFFTFFLYYRIMFYPT